MTFVRKTWNRMIHIIIFLIFVVYSLSIYLAWQNGSTRGYTLGRIHEKMESPFRSYSESEKPFCYDKGLFYQVKKGKKSFIPEF